MSSHSVLFIQKNPFILPLILLHRQLCGGGFHQWQRNAFSLYLRLYGQEHLLQGKYHRFLYREQYRRCFAVYVV